MASISTRAPPFHTTYDAGGKLVAEYSTTVAPQSTAQVSYLTNDRLGSPRITTDKDGKVFSRRDFLPFGEDLDGYVTAERTAAIGYGPDSVRQKFTGYERDGETELDFAKARMHNHGLGRFQSPDPVFYQISMVLDPQLFNLYTYVRNNPAKFIDPLGEEVRVVGNRTATDIYDMVGGRETFEKYFELSGDQVVVKEGSSIEAADDSVQNLAGLVGEQGLYVFYSGNDFNEISHLFEGAQKKDKNGNVIVAQKGDDKGQAELTEYGENLKRQFEGKNQQGKPNRIGYVVRVRGRFKNESPSNLNGKPIYAMIAVNSDVPIVQSGVESGFSEHTEGLSNQVAVSSMFIHEAAEAQEFGRIGFFDKNGKTTYKQAHSHAIRVEIKVFKALKRTGGYAGGVLERGN